MCVKHWSSIEVGCVCVCVSVAEAVGVMSGSGLSEQPTIFGPVATHGQPASPEVGCGCVSYPQTSLFQGFRQYMYIYMR